MKQLIVIIFCAISTYCFAQTKPEKFEVPVEAKTTFRQQFPTATETYWKPYFKVLEVTFYNEINGKFFGTKAWYNRDGEWLKTAETIERKVLPQTIQDYLNEFFKYETIGMFQKISRPEGTPNYSIVTGTFDRTRTIIFDETAKVIDVNYSPWRDE